MKDGLIKIGAVAPQLRPLDVRANAENIVEAARAAAEVGVRVLVTPELSTVGATAADLLFQTTLFRSAEAACERIADETRTLDMLLFVGVPVAVRGALYNCMAAISHGRVLGIVPKTWLPNARDAFERRYFTAAPVGVSEISFAGALVPFGTDILFECEECPSLVIAAEVGAELLAPISPSARHATAGATLIVNSMATAETVGKRERIRTVVSATSAKCVCAYLLAGAGSGESGTDGVYSAHSLVAQCGRVLAESEPYADGVLTSALVDLEKITADRMRQSEFMTEEAHLTVRFSLGLAETEISPAPSRTPFIPEGEEARRARCEQILEIQARALAGRIERSYSKTAVIGVSGGLDSTLALLVCARAFDILGRDRKGIVSVTMPCYGTTARTRTNAEVLAEALGTTLRVVDIKEAVGVHFRDIGHDPECFDVVYENAQARERTQVLMDIANAEGGLVVGTGDLSELALGFATYNGDHMSMYAPNADVPKTLIRHIVATYAKGAYVKGDTRVAEVLCDILATPVSPELLPPKDGDIAQCTEKIVGPYELHDYFLYYLVRFGFSPRKIYRLASASFAGVYEPSVIHGWLTVFIKRFFAQQFKRSCLPDGPKIANVAFSPRADWKMPSDAVAAEWLRELEECK